MTVLHTEVTAKEQILETMKGWLLETLGDSVDIMLPELAEMFLEDGPVLFSGIKDAIATQDRVLLKERSHALKGSSASMGLEVLASHCQVVENCSKEGDFATAVSQMPLLQAEFDQVISLFNDLT